VAADYQRAGPVEVVREPEVGRREGAHMKRLIVLSLITAGIALTTGLSTPAYAQAPTPSDTPTFYRLVPGTYVNGWPRFTITYPKEWVEIPRRTDEIFAASVPGPVRDPSFAVMIGPLTLGFENRKSTRLLKYGTCRYGNQGTSERLVRWFVQVASRQSGSTYEGSLL
jgi:hypothetical protein